MDLSEKKRNALLKSKAVNRMDQQIVSVVRHDGYHLSKPLFSDVNFKEWLKTESSTLDKYLKESGAILFRGFGLNTISAFKEFIDVLGIGALEYSNRSSPRTELQDKIYTSTDHPADQKIFMHNELSYSTSWPQKIIFFCHTPAQEGGETPIADGRKVLLALSNDTRRRFQKEGITYMRNLTKGVGMSWEQVFNTNDKNEVESYCIKNNTAFEWKPDGSLIIKWKRPAIVTHPVTYEEIWFNHGLFFNSYTLGEEKLAVLKDALPFETFYGNGEPIEKAVLAEIAAAYEKTIVTFSWEKGDLLLLDNMLMAHGRNTFRGKREIMVAMAEEIYSPNQNL